MTRDSIEQAIGLMQNQHFGEALHILDRVIKQDSAQWNAWYMAGQCCRFLNDLEGAIPRLARATELKSDEPAVLLAFGIALQLSGRWDDAIEAFRQAIAIDSGL